MFYTISLQIILGEMYACMHVYASMCMLVYIFVRVCLCKEQKYLGKILFSLFMHRSKDEKRLDVDDEDDQESYFNARKDVPLIPYPDEDDEIEYDSDGNPIPPEKSKVFFLMLCLILQFLFLLSTFLT